MSVIKKSFSLIQFLAFADYGSRSGKPIMKEQESVKKAFEGKGRIFFKDLRSMGTKKRRRHDFVSNEWTSKQEIKNYHE